ncbi:MAG: hypothetical protein A2504_07340 [Bdellovibrionales bacterium RIFOXYD12_FULL_39_22]|nr:MAG: hypothetical protein A2385_16710 [Bdellovibrionales bacterium RIFOXYB1_FULL_39_21]OFZ44692.1 MAG: hypothetical protein A2485_14570 [Bdellovibrionales bacterium RIFOXYC12_FULL_39_17]OFZ49322.1 MAG: hypothetical protein A2404_08865 [Bdellovibrionales bacterium RIFOXYC1_FULL_39_130]OFZ77058.1 MAG: hypothetical protein A2560_09830 [Bdellovibrionales bacterium RIFOXYD1_FULL_39_84]OFZ95318.1 MAG: hypothetical protein A2504_07340 [Bdellovibrionales bacterium RIFOXYD12_FULL_39_22]HLE13066.1 re
MDNNKNRARIVLVDDHTVLRVGLKSFLEEQQIFPLDVVAEGSSGKEAVLLVEKHNPDLLLLDLSMPEMGGHEATIEIRKNNRLIKILILTQYNESIYLKRLLEAGANGYILKSARGEELVSAIRSVISGGTYIDPTMASSILANKFSANLAATTGVSDEELYAKLTAREQQVLKFIADGLSNKEIADKLDVAVKTAMVHRANLMDKLNIKNRSKLIQFAIRVGVLNIDK